MKGIWLIELKAEFNNLDLYIKNNNNIGLCHKVK